MKETDNMLNLLKIKNLPIRKERKRFKLKCASTWVRMDVPNGTQEVVWILKEERVEKEW